MTESKLPDDALEALLRARAPAPLAEGDFVARTLAAVDRSTPRRAAPPRVASPREIARALVQERRRGALLARLRHWGLAGVMAGVLLTVLAVLEAPAGAGGAAIASGGAVLFPLWLALVCGAAWLAWQELRSA